MIKVFNLYLFSTILKTGIVHLVSSQHVMTYRLFLCCVWHGPGGEHTLDIVPRETELEHKLRRGVGQAVHTRNNSPRQVK
jgi:hypothetical protein